MLTEEQKAEIRLWHDRLKGPDARHWMASSDLIEFTNRLWPLMLKPTDDGLNDDREEFRTFLEEVKRASTNVPDGRR